MITFKQFLESRANLYQVRIANDDWQDDVDLGVSSLAAIVREVRGRDPLDLHSLHAEPDSLSDTARRGLEIAALPTIHEMVCKYHGATKANHDFFDEEADYDVRSLKHDVLVLTYEMTIRTKRDGGMRNVQGEVRIMPQG